MKVMIQRTGILIAATFFTSAPLAKAYDMTNVNQRVSAVLGKKLHEIDSALRVYHLSQDADFVALENICKTDWDEVIDNLNLVDGNDEGRLLVIWALQALDADDYMTALEMLVAKYETDTLDKALIIEAVHPEGRMRGFLADNYQHSRVIAALNDVKTKAAGDTEFISEIDDILGGQAKTGLDDFRGAHPDTSEGNIPVITLQ